MNAQPTTVPGDGLSKLFAEVPAELFFLVCGASMALVVFLMWLAYAQSRRNKASEMASANGGQNAVGTAAVAAPGISRYAPITPPTTDPRTSDMPDLDSLLDTTSLTKGPDGMDDSTPKMPSPPPSLQPVPMRKQGPGRVELPTGEVIEAEEVIAVLRDPRDGRLVVQIDGVAYRTLVASPEVKKKFVQVMKQLSELVTRPDDNPPVDTVQKPAPPETAHKAPPEPQHPASPEPPVLKKPVSGPPPPMEDGTMPGDLPSFKLDDNKPPEGKDEKPAPIPEIDLVGAIEAYLQHKLKYTPQYAHRSIHVKPALDGGVLIQVDNNFYQAVGDVADTEIREFLMVTIQEWQDRQKR